MTDSGFLRIRVFLLLTGLLCCIASSCTQEIARPYKNLKYPGLGDIEMPNVQKVTLANGMRLFLVEDHELPLISVSARIRTGSVYEPAEKIGLASITGTVMRTGGTTSKTGDELDEQLESIAASVETGIGLNSGSASMSVLKEDVDTGLAILADVLMNPAFSEDKILLAKIQRRSTIARRNDNVGAIASREFDKLIYGPDSVYARHTEYATIESITRDDLIDFHEKFYKPNNVMLGVLGDFDTKQMIKKIEKAFEKWQKAGRHQSIEYLYGTHRRAHERPGLFRTGCYEQDSRWGLHGPFVQEHPVARGSRLFGLRPVFIQLRFPRRLLCRVSDKIQIHRLRHPCHDRRSKENDRKRSNR
jgi:hypothetical protein